MVNLYIARSPLQLYNCIEASKRFQNGRRNVLLMIGRQQYDKRLMRNVSEYGDWDEVVVWGNENIFSQMVLVVKFLSKTKKISNCVIGDYTRAINFIINTVVPEKIIWVDDGVATLQRAKLIASGAIHSLTKHFRPKLKIASLVEKIARIDVRYQQDTAYFTIYHEIEEELTGYEVIRNDYSYFKQKYSLLPYENCVYFIGNDLRRYVLKDKSTFESYLSTVNDYYSGRKITYVMHRKENPDFMIQMGKKYGFDIISFDDIIEIQILKQGWCPAEIATFCSSALDTISLLCKPKMTVFKISMDDVKDDRLVGMTELYKRYDSMELTAVTKDTIRQPQQ